MGEADKRGKEEMEKEDVEQEEEGCKSKHCEQQRRHWARPRDAGAGYRFVCMYACMYVSN